MLHRFTNLFPISNEHSVLNSDNEINPYLLENNKNQLEIIKNFYENKDEKILYLNGIMGSGKAEIIRYSLGFLDEDVIKLKYNCFNSTVLDDILLSFFKEFRNLTQRGIIFPPKVKTEAFNERINAYFASVDKPFVIILDSFEAILDENRQEILDFIFHVISTGKAKVVIIGRSYNKNLFTGHKVTRVTTAPMERKIFDKFIKNEKVHASSHLLDELYEHVKGNYYYTLLTLEILKTENISLETLLNRQKEKLIPYPKVLEQELLSIVPSEVTLLFWFLILIRHDISLDLLKKIELYDEENINYLISNKIIVRENDNIYINDYFDDITFSAPQTMLMRLRQYMVDMYQSQLPLKPLERDICISRQTMRKEIAFHGRFIPRKPIVIENKSTDIDMLSYSNIIAQSQKDSILFEQKNEAHINYNEEKNNPVSVDINSSKIRNTSLNINDLNIKSPISKDIGNVEPMPVNETPQEEKTYSFHELMNLINKAEKTYQYAEVLEFAHEALALKSDEHYKEMLPFIYMKMANAYDKTAQHDKALGYYGLLEKIYAGDINKLSHIKIKVADIYYETYKFDQAKEIYYELIPHSDISDAIKLHAYLKLINIAEEQQFSQDETVKLLNEASKIAEISGNMKALSELYFKYALILDDTDDISGAAKYYEKCIKTLETTENKYLSSAYSNLASLSLENNDEIAATEYYKKAYEVDNELKNYEGIYDSASKIAELLRTKAPNSAIEYLKHAFAAAKKVNEPFYVISSAISAGDFYYNTKKEEIALKYYYFAYNYAQDKTSEQNLERIKRRLSDIKNSMGYDKYENLIEMLKLQEEENE